MNPLIVTRLGTPSQRTREVSSDVGIGINDDLILADSRDHDITITLPPPVDGIAEQGRRFRIMKVSAAHAVRIKTADGVPPHGADTLKGKDSWAEVTMDGKRWTVFASDK